LKPWPIRSLLTALLAAIIPAQADPSFSERLQGLFRDQLQSSAGREFLPADEAFRFTAAPAGQDRLTLKWRIADGYYLYRDKFRFRVVEGDASIAADAIIIPDGTVKSDEVFGEVEVNTGEVTINLPVHPDQGRAGEFIVLQVTYQGCKEDAICYPPISRDVAMALTAGNGGSVKP